MVIGGALHPSMAIHEITANSKRDFLGSMPGMVTSVLPG
jgi:hypothetical protein